MMIIPLFVNVGATGCCAFLGSFKGKYDLYWCAHTQLKVVFKDDLTVRKDNCRISELSLYCGSFDKAFVECYFRAVEAGFTYHRKKYGHLRS